MTRDNNRAPLWLGGLRNLIHSAVLIAAMVGLLGLVGGLFGGTWLLMVLLGFGVAFLALGAAVGSSVLLRMQGAVPLSQYHAPRLAELMRQLAHRAGLPAVPQLFLVPTPAVTAYTTGTRDNASIAVTHGLLQALDLRELAGVLAHEVSHIRRNDIWVMGLANLVRRATKFMSLLGQILLLVNLPLLMMGQFTLSWMAILLLVFAPTVSVLLQFALSRAREYQADADAVRLTGDSNGLASALAKLERMNAGFLRHFMRGRPTNRGWSLLQTHPSTRDRIERILRLGGVAEAGVA